MQDLLDLLRLLISPARQFDRTDDDRQRLAETVLGDAESAMDDEPTAGNRDVSNQERFLERSRRRIAPEPGKWVS